MANDNKNLIKKMLYDVGIAYLMGALMIIIVRALFAFFNEEALLENIMLNVRTFLLGVIDAKEYFFVAKIESIRFYAIHLSIFFALFFNYIFEKRGLLTVSIAGIIILIICGLRFLLCIHIGMAISIILYLLIGLLGEKRHFFAIYRILLLICTIFPIILEILANI